MTFKEHLIKWNEGIWRGAPRKFSKLINYTEGAVSDWIHNKEIPGESIRKRIADELGITVPELMACFPPRQPAAGIIAESPAAYNQPAGMVPTTDVIGVVNAGAFTEPPADPVIIDTIPWPHIAGGRRRYALRISGDCMAPRALDGHYALITDVSDANDVPDGETAVVCFDGECTLKKIYHRGDQLELVPLNPEYASRRVKRAKAKIIGHCTSYYVRP